MSDSVSVRDSLVEALQLDLVGPRGDSVLATERLDKAPSRWYLTGFLVPVGAPVDSKRDDDEGASRGKEKKRSVRYRWPDELRDEVLARLIALNAERATAEAEAAEAKASEKAAKGVLRLVSVKPETVAEAFRAWLEKEKMSAEEYREKRGLDVIVVERVLATELPFDPKDLATTALALAKDAGGDETPFRAVLREIEHARLKKTRKPPVAMAARKKGDADEP